MLITVLRKFYDGTSTHIQLHSKLTTFMTVSWVDLWRHSETCKPYYEHVDPHGSGHVLQSFNISTARKDHLGWFANFICLPENSLATPELPTTIEDCVKCWFMGQALGAPAFQDLMLGRVAELYNKFNADTLLSIKPFWEQLPAFTPRPAGHEAIQWDLSLPPAEITREQATLEAIEMTRFSGLLLQIACLRASSFGLTIGPPILANLPDNVSTAIDRHLAKPIFYIGSDLPHATWASTCQIGMFYVNIQSDSIRQYYNWRQYEAAHQLLKGRDCG